MDDRLIGALHGKSHSQGGYNLPELRQELVKLFPREKTDIIAFKRKMLEIEFLPEVSALYEQTERMDEYGKILIDIREGGLHLQDVPKKYRDNIDVILTTISIWGGDEFRYVNEESKDDPDLVKDAVTWDHKVFKYVSERLKNDVSFIVEVGRENPRIFEYVDQKFRDDPNIILDVFEYNGLALDFASFRLKNDPRFMHEAWKINPEDADRFVGPELKEHPNKYQMAASQIRGRKY